MIRRPLATVVLALVAAFTLVGLPVGPLAQTEVLAATPDLTMVSTARYVVQPDEARVRVTVDITFRNHLTDTKTTRYYFDRAYLQVQPGVSGLGFSWNGKGTPKVSTYKKTDTYTMLRLDLAERLYGGASAAYRLVFDLRDPGGAPTRPLRVGDSLVRFSAWAFASESTPGSSVSLDFPAGFEVDVEAGSIGAPRVAGDGRVILESGSLEQPLRYVVAVVAERPSAYATSTLTATLGDETAEIVVRSWPDDEAWSTRVTGLLTDGLPALADAIGIDWQIDDGLIVQEALAGTTGRYAGLFDPGAGRVEIAYYADDFVVLHEAAHAWFNGALLADRWANEAFASFYALHAAQALELELTGDVLTEALQADRIPLNAWGAVGTEEPAQESYAYAAALALAKSIAARAGDEGLRRVWTDAADGTGAYQPLGGPREEAPGTVAGADPDTAAGSPAPDWRGLLDLLEENTDAMYDDLWRTWVARPSDLALLDQRATARARFFEVRATTRGWRLPVPIRDALRAWQFDQAMTLLDAAADGLTARAAVERAASDAGLIVPATLKHAFEDSDGFDDVLAEAEAELETIERYESARAARPAEITPIVTLGLWDEMPEEDLTTARAAFARGDLDASAVASAAAYVTWSDAVAIGQGRALSIVLLAVAALLFAALVVSFIRTRGSGGRRRRPTDMAHAIGLDAGKPLD